MRARAVITLFLFGGAALLALKYREAGLAVCCCCLVGYLRPEAPGVALHEASPRPGKRRVRRRA